MKLADLGFLKGVIEECIISTYSIEGKVDAAPMGVIVEDEAHVIVTFFNSSATCNNIKANKCATVNLTSNIEVFYKTAFKEANINGKLPQEWFEKARSVNAPKLRSAEATIEVSVTELVPLSSEKTKAVFEIKLLEATPKYPQVYCRAMAATLEAILHGTRVKFFINDKNKQKQVTTLLEQIQGCNELVKKVAPNSVYSTVMVDLLKRIDLWRQKKSRN